MQREGARLLYSPSDLVRFMESPFASWCERMRLEDPRDLRRDPDDELLEILQRKGLSHELEVLEDLRGPGLLELDPSNSNALQETREAIGALTPVIYQASLRLGQWAGQPDFLVLAGGGYEIWDAKLAKKPKPYFLVQLCCYAELLAPLTGELPAVVAVVLGSGETVHFRVADYFYLYRHLKASFLRQMDDFDPSRMPLPEPGARFGRWTSRAEEAFGSTDHLIRIANIRRSQIARLEAAGIRSLTHLSTAQLDHVQGIQDETLARLKDQAWLQLETVKSGRTQFKVLATRVDDPRRGLAVLPPLSRNDVFFDLEGYPFVNGGLEYLFGACFYSETGALEYRDWWAHDRAAERSAFEGFVDWVYDLWAQHPEMHVFHYGVYETAALRRLAGRFASREDEVAELLLSEVFVDLYTVVRQGVRIGEPNYSLKSVENIFREKRGGEVADATSSIVFYERWVEGGEADLLAAIGLYNKEDCESTAALAEWLVEQQRSEEIAYIPRPVDYAGRWLTDEATEEISRHRKLAEELLDDLKENKPGGERRVIQQGLAHLLEFYHREEKPAWWTLFSRHEMSEQELIEDIDCLGALRLSCSPPIKIKRSTGWVYEFPAQDTNLARRQSAVFAHDLNAVVEIHEIDQNARTVCLKVGPSKLKQLGGHMPDSLSLLPDEFRSYKTLKESLYSIALRWQQEGQLPNALRDLLLRVPPRLSDNLTVEEIARSASDLETAQQIVDAMASTTLCVQGPPGSGKTYTGATLVTRLLGKGLDVGIASTSHKAILNLMRACAFIDKDLVCTKVGGPRDDMLFSQCVGADYVSSSGKAAASYEGGLIGGTAWFFARDDMAGRLDYLFIDEAGQVSLAHVAAMSRAAKNLVLLGDQMQLSQPIRGAHPGDSGLSALQYLLQGRSTIPPGLGVFLHETRRLHPALCALVSESVYGGVLRPHESTRSRVIRSASSKLIAVEAGLVYVPVLHVGNTHESPEEVPVVVGLVEELLGRALTNESGEDAGVVTLEDVLIVAPFNVQVRRLREALPKGARVGTVDAFQGQEAAAVVVSMCSSPSEFSQRYLEFVLDENRLNVAISRARSLAIVVGHPDLANGRLRNLSDCRRANFYCRILEADPG